MPQTTEAGSAVQAAAQDKTMQRLAIIVREGSYDRVLTPLAFAYLAAASDVHVDMLFVNWAVRGVMKEESQHLPMSAEHADELDYVRQRVAAAGLPPDIPDIITAIKSTGNVSIYVCSLAATIFEATEDNVLPEVDGIIGATWFLADCANGADITQCF